MLIVNSVADVPVRLTVERWQHILCRHPEMETEENRILETLSSPDLVQEGDYNTKVAIKYYPQTPLTNKHLAVIYKEVSADDGFILTAYFTSKPNEGRKVLWKR